MKLSKGINEPASLVPPCQCLARKEGSQGQRHRKKSKCAAKNGSLEIIQRGMDSGYDLNEILDNFEIATV